MVNPHTDRLLLLMITSVLIIGIVVGMVFIFQHVRIFENQQVAIYYLEHLILDEQKARQLQQERSDEADRERDLILNETLNLSRQLNNAVKTLQQHNIVI